MGVKLFLEKDRQKWNQFVRNFPQANAYHMIEWKEVIESSFGKKTFYLFSEDGDGRVNGVLPIVNLKSVFFGNFFVSLPYFNYGGVSAENERVCQELVDESIQLARREKVHHLELRHKANVLNGFPCQTKKISMQLSLPASKEELWKQMPAKLRSQIRRPLKEGMYSRVGKEDELGSFYRVFSRNMRDLGTPVYGVEFFRNILKGLPETTRICTVYDKSHEPVASGFLVGFREVLEIPWASSLREWNKFSPNMLLYWNCLEFACENGYKVFDFGRSTPGEGPNRFKEQWGAKPVQLYWHYWLREAGQVPQINPQNPKYRAVIKIWQRLPVSWTKIIGPRIVKNLP